MKRRTEYLERIHTHLYLFDWCIIEVAGTRQAGQRYNIADHTCHLLPQPAHVSQRATTGSFVEELEHVSQPMIGCASPRVPEFCIPAGGCSPSVVWC